MVHARRRGLLLVEVHKVFPNTAEYVAIMKKVLYLIILPVIGMVCCAITACSSDDDEGSGIVVSPSSISLHYEETQQLKADGATSWLSEDEFVASVDQSGLVKGGHVGTTKIIATNGSKKSACEVTITPKYYLFDEPLLRWGASMSSIQAAETHEKQNVSSDEVLLYNYTSGATACLMMYDFDNNKLRAVMALLNNSMYVTAGYYLLEHYQPFYIGDNNDYYFMDAMNIEKAKVVVRLDRYKMNSTTYTCIYFADRAALLSSSGTRSSLDYPQIPINILEKLQKISVK